MKEAEFKKLPIMGILREIGKEALEPLLEVAISAGLKTLEITMNTKGAPGLIKKAAKISSGKLTLGAGTVLNKKDLRSALDAGATFIVTPVLVKEVMEFCLKNKIPVFPGALTPEEIYNAWNAGATMVKVFPAKFFGPGYFREIKGPFNDIELLACSGVTADNMQEYFVNGASAVSFGESLFRKEWLAEKNFISIKQEIKKFIDKYKSLYPKPLYTRA